MDAKKVFQDTEICIELHSLNGSDIEVQKRVPLLKFPFAQHPFILMENYCPEWDCRCQTAMLVLAKHLPVDLEQESSTNDTIADQVSFDLSLGDWEVSTRDPVSPQEEQLLEAFQKQLTPRQINYFLYNMMREKEQEAQLQAFRMLPEKIGEKQVVPYGRVFLADEPNDTKMKWYWRAWVEESTLFYLEDLYCVNPACHCGNVVLRVYAFNQQDKMLMEHATVSYHFTKGIGLIEISDLPLDVDLLEMIGSRRDQDPDLEVELSQRYWLMKRAGMRAMTHMEKPSSIVKRKRIPRNAPCPCGSGKKYKKCCG